MATSHPVGRTRAFMTTPKVSLLQHDSAAEAAEAAEEADAVGGDGEPLDDVDRLATEAVSQAKAARGGDDKELAPTTGSSGVRAGSDGEELAPPKGPAMEAPVSDTLQLSHGREGGTGEASVASGRWLAYGICTLVTWNLFCNHWNRDSVGALELPLEAPPFVRVRVRVRTLTLTLTLALPLPYPKPYSEP